MPFKRLRKVGSRKFDYQERCQSYPHCHTARSLLALSVYRWPAYVGSALIRKRNSSYVCNNPEGRGPLSIITWAIKRHTPSISFCSTRQERSPSLLCNDRVKSHLPISFTSWTISKLNCPNVTRSVLWHFYIGNSLANNCWDFATTCLLLWSIG